MRLRVLVLLLSLPAASACAQKDATPDSLDISDVRAFTEACVNTSNMGQSICACTADKAKKELTETGFKFLLATLQEDEKQAERLRGELDMTEAMEAGMFLANAPADCAEDGAPEDR